MIRLPECPRLRSLIIDGCGTQRLRDPLPSMKILVIEDDEKIAAYLAKGLREAGYVVDVAHDGHDGADLAIQGEYAAAVVDIMLPGVDGLTIIGNMRQQGVATPVLILSARHTVDDRVHGLKTGGDDYMVKPFSFAEVEARIQA